MVKEIQLLRQRDIFPSEPILRQALGGELLPVFENFMHGLAEQGLKLQWNYYVDGKAWLCKVVRGAKTVLWLSVWDGFFQTGFYFTDRTGGGIASLDIDPKLKESYRTTKPVGRLRPLVVKVRGADQATDALALARYKTAL